MDALDRRRCQPCTGATPRVPRTQAEQYLRDLKGWSLGEEGDAIECQLQTQNFRAALELFGRIGEVADAEGHHPDLHLTGYNRVKIVLSTHAIGGLSENDFILA